MSNQSTCFIEFSGSREILIKIGRSIVDKNLNPDFVDKNRKSNVLFEEGLEEEIELDMILEGNILSIFFFGTFRGEYYWFKKVCEFYGLCGKYSDSENVYDFYHKIIYKNGVLIKEIWDKFFCKESIEVLGIDFFIDEYESFFNSEDLKIDEYLKKIYSHVKNVFMEYGFSELEVDDLILEKRI